MKREKNTVHFRSLLITTIIICPFILCGCVDENIVPNEGNVQVQMFDCNLFPGNIANSTVSTGQYPQVIPDYNGIAKLKITSFPYNFNVTFGYPPDDFRHIIFDGVTNTKNCIMPMQKLETWEWKAAKILINYPVIPNYKQAFIKFISRETFVDYPWSFGDYLVGSGSSIMEYTVYFPSIKSGISGKLIFIECTFSGEEFPKIISIDNYGEKNINLSEGSGQTVAFTNEEISYNPADEYTYFSFNLPPGITGYSYQVSLSFDGYTKTSDLPINQYFPRVEFVAPSGLPSAYKLKIYNGFNTYDTIWEASQEKWFFMDPGSFVTLDNSIQPELLNPPDGLKKINDSTAFTYRTNSNNGIYYIQFLYERFKTQTFVTAKNNVTFGELKDKGILFLPGKLYYWWVEQPSGFSSVDEYLSSPYILNPKYTSKSCSAVRSFTTAP